MTIPRTEDEWCVASPTKQMDSKCSVDNNSSIIHNQRDALARWIRPIGTRLRERTTRSAEPREDESWSRHVDVQVDPTAGDTIGATTTTQHTLQSVDATVIHGKVGLGAQQVHQLLRAADAQVPQLILPLLLSGLALDAPIGGRECARGTSFGQAALAQGLALLAGENGLCATHVLLLLFLLLLLLLPLCWLSMRRACERTGRADTRCRYPPLGDFIWLLRHTGIPPDTSTYVLPP